MSAFPHRIRPLPRRLRLILLLSAAGILCFFLRSALSQLLFQVGLAVVLACIAAPICRVLEKRFPPSLAALLSLLSLLALLVLFLTLLIPRLISRFSQALSAVPQLIGMLQSLMQNVTSSPFFGRLMPYISPSGDLLQRAGDLILSVVPRVLQTVGRIANRILRAFLAPALAFYFLRDRELFCFQISLLIPLRLRRQTLWALREMRREVAGYYRGQLLVVSSVALLTALALLIVGVPGAPVLGLLMGICDLIPYIGPYLGAIPIILFALPLGMHTVLWAVIAVIAVQQIESLFLSPHFMSGATGLHPAYVLILISLGGLIGGLGGMLLSLPLFVCLRGAVRAVQCTSHEHK